MHFRGKNETGDCDIAWPEGLEKHHELKKGSADRFWTVEDYEKRLTEDPNFEFTKTVYMECGYGSDPEKDFENGLLEAKAIQALCERHPRFVGYIAHCNVLKGKKFVEDFVDALRDDNGIFSHYLKGVRIVLICGDKVDWYTENTKEAMQVLEKNNLIYEIAVDLRYFEETLKLVKNFPNLKFTLNHCGANDLGKFENWEEKYKPVITEMASLPNVVCKLGAQEQFMTDPLHVLRHCIKEFGWDKCLAESNWFVGEAIGWKFSETFSNVMKVCKELGATQEQLNKVFYENAEKWYSV